MKKQTAVNWLNSELERLSNQIGVNLSWAIVDDLIKQAKEIEKDEIIDSVIYGNKEPLMADPKLLGENYYNEKFK